MFTFFTTGTFWFLLGILFVVVVVGAYVWFEDKGIKMTWWKWLLALLWYAFLNISIAAPFTFFAEKEPKGAWATLGIFGVLTVILGVGLWRLLMSNRHVEAVPASD